MGSNGGVWAVLLWCFLDLGEARVKRGSIRGAAADIEYIAKFCFAAQSDDTPGRLRRVRPLRCTAILVSKLSLHADDDSAKFSYVIDIDDNSTAASSLPTESAYLKVFDAKQWRYITSNRSLSCVHSHSASDRCSCSRSGCRSCEEKLSLAVTSRMMGRELGRLNASRNTYTFLFKQKPVARWWCRSFVHALCCAAFARSARQRRGANVRMHARRRYAAIMSCAQPIPNLRSVCFDSMRKGPPAPSESFLAPFLPVTSRACVQLHSHVLEPVHLPLQASLPPHYCGDLSRLRGYRCPDARLCSYEKHGLLPSSAAFCLLLVPVMLLGVLLGRHAVAPSRMRTRFRGNAMPCPNMHEHLRRRKSGDTASLSAPGKLLYALDRTCTRTSHLGSARLCKRRALEADGHFCSSLCRCRRRSLCSLVLETVSRALFWAHFSVYAHDGEGPVIGAIQARQNNKPTSGAGAGGTVTARVCVRACARACAVLARACLRVCVGVCVICARRGIRTGRERARGGLDLRAAQLGGNSASTVRAAGGARRG